LEALQVVNEDHLYLLKIGFAWIEIIPHHHCEKKNEGCRPAPIAGGRWRSLLAVWLWLEWPVKDGTRMDGVCSANAYSHPDKHGVKQSHCL